MYGGIFWGIWGTMTNPVNPVAAAPTIQSATGQAPVAASPVMTPSPPASTVTEVINPLHLPTSDEFHAVNKRIPPNSGKTPPPIELVPCLDAVHVQPPKPVEPPPPASLPGAKKLEEPSQKAEKPVEDDKKGKDGKETEEPKKDDPVVKRTPGNAPIPRQLVEDIISAFRSDGRASDVTKKGLIAELVKQLKRSPEALASRPEFAGPIEDAILSVLAEKNWVMNYLMMMGLNTSKLYPLTPRIEAQLDALEKVYREAVGGVRGEALEIKEYIQRRKEAELTAAAEKAATNQKGPLPPMPGGVPMQAPGSVPPSFGGQPANDHPGQKLDVTSAA